ncbi:MAG: TetR/AcrR family transcriptional regulator [Burkholderiaceae bacterium]|nr:TetR/AcrR family transcriptional regulator [Microbacteriaceae bacterium]
MNETAPARGTRPRNRRALIVAAATSLFVERGYARVFMDDIARELNVVPSSLYRHFTGKPALLVAVIRSEFAFFIDVVAEGGTPTEVLRRFAACELDHRGLGVLWQREARNLPAEEQVGIRADIRLLTSTLAALVSAERPGLSAREVDFIAAGVISAGVSVSFHHSTLPRNELIDLLSGVMARIFWLEAPVGEPMQVAAEPAAAGRREAVLAGAIELFAKRGFAATSVDDIGAAAGITGPTIYHHFSGKHEILAAAIQSGMDDLWEAVRLSDRAGGGPKAMLEREVAAYTAFAVARPYSIRTLIAELDQLPLDERAVAVESQRRLVARWVKLQRAVTGDGEIVGRIRILAVTSVVNDLVQTSRLRSGPGFASALTAVARSLVV